VLLRILVVNNDNNRGSVGAVVANNGDAQTAIYTGFGEEISLQKTDYSLIV